MPKLRLSLRMGVTALSLVVAFVTGVTRPATAQVVVADGVANCVWLKLTAHASGFEVEDAAAGLGPKRSLKADCYMQLVFMAPDANNPNGRYGAPILCPLDFVNWGTSSMDASFSGKALADGNVIAVDDYLSFTNAAGDLIEGYGTHRLLISVDKKTGAFAKATFQTLGAEMIDGSLFNESFVKVTGGYTVKGSSVPAAKVPPEALALVAGGPCGP